MIDWITKTVISEKLMADLTNRIADEADFETNKKQFLNMDAIYVTGYMAGMEKASEIVVEYLHRLRGEILDH